MSGHIQDRGKYKDGSTKWQARYPEPSGPSLNGSGKTVWPEIVKTFRRKREAEDWLAAQLTAINNGTHVDPRRADRTFCELVEAWADARWASFAPSTRERYVEILYNHLGVEFDDEGKAIPTKDGGAFGRAKVGQIDKGAVRRYFGKLGRRVEAGELSGGSVHKIHTVLSSIFSEAVEAGTVPINPASRLRGLPSAHPQHEMLFLDSSEVQALADAINPAYRTLILTAAYAGLRSGELFALRRQDLTLADNQLRVVRSIKEWVDGEPVFGSTKSGKPRAVSLPKFLTQALAQQLIQSAPLTGTTPDALVFTTIRAGNTNSKCAIRREPFVANHFRPAVLKALPNQQKLRLHDLRHTHVALMIAQGAQPKSIQVRCGHSSITTTLDRYGHLFPGHDDDVMDGLDATFTG